MEVVTTKDEFGSDVVQWVWRKKAYAKRGQEVQNKMNNPAYFVLETSDKNVLLAWRAPLEIDERGTITFDEGVMPCTLQEEDRLDKSFKARNPSLFTSERYEQQKEREEKARKEREEKARKELQEATKIFE